MQNYEVALVSRPGRGAKPAVENYAYRESDTPEITDDDIIVQTLYLCMDPALRSRMDAWSGVMYMDAWPLNQTVEGLAGVGVVIKSTSSAYKQGDIVEAAFGWPWKLYFSANKCEPSLRLSLKKVADEFVKKKWYTIPLSCIGMVGITAFLCLHEMGRPRPGDVCVVTDAAGPFGSLVVQIAGLLGCEKVIGICETEEKCAYVTAELGVTAAINTSNQDVASRLKELAPNGVNIYIDNCGGDLSDSIILQMKKKGRVVVCDQTSQYNATSGGALPQLGDDADLHVDMEEIKREKFITLSYDQNDKWQKALDKLKYWLLSGELKVKETIYDGMESCGKAFSDLMHGRGMGSVLVKVSELDTAV